MYHEVLKASVKQSKEKEQMKIKQIKKHTKTQTQQLELQTKTEKKRRSHRQVCTQKVEQLQTTYNMSYIR